MKGTLVELFRLIALVGLIGVRLGAPLTPILRHGKFLYYTVTYASH